MVGIVECSWTRGNQVPIKQVTLLFKIGPKHFCVTSSEMCSKRRYVVHDSADEHTRLFYVYGCYEVSERINVDKIEERISEVRLSCWNITVSRRVNMKHYR